MASGEDAAIGDIIKKSDFHLRVSKIRGLREISSSSKRTMTNFLVLESRAEGRWEGRKRKPHSGDWASHLGRGRFPEPLMRFGRAQHGGKASSPVSAFQGGTWGVLVSRRETPPQMSSWWSLTQVCQTPNGTAPIEASLCTKE